MNIEYKSNGISAKSNNDEYCVEAKEQSFFDLFATEMTHSQNILENILNCFEMILDKFEGNGEENSNKSPGEDKLRYGTVERYNYIHDRQRALVNTLSDCVTRLEKII